MEFAHLLDHAPENLTRFEALHGSLAARKLNFFVGAGLSVPCGMPEWSRFLTTLGKRASIEGAVAALLHREKYEDAAQLAYEALGSLVFEEALIGAFGLEDLPHERLLGLEAITQLPGLALFGQCELIMTSNFDRMLESVFRGSGALDTVINGARPELVREAFASSHRFLWKIHGDVRDPTDRVLLKSEYARSYGHDDEHTIDLSRSLPDTLRHCFSTKSLLFLGCSLSRDRTMATLRSVESNSGPIHFAVLEDNGASALDRVKRDHDLLNHYRIKAFWYPRGEHSSVPLLLREVYKAAFGSRARVQRLSRSGPAIDHGDTGDVLERDRLCEADFESGAAIRPPQLTNIMDVLLDGGRLRTGRHIAIVGKSASGKTAMAAWIEFELTGRGCHVEYFRGKEHQSGGRLLDEMKQMKPHCVAIIDDVHLVHEAVNRLIRSGAISELSLVLIGRSGMFEAIDIDRRSPAFTTINADPASVASEIARRHCGGDEARLAALLKKAPEDLVGLKMMLRDQRELEKDAVGNELRQAKRELQEIKNSPPNGTDLVRLYATLACFQVLEFRCPIRILSKIFNFLPATLDQLCVQRRDAVPDDRGEVELDGVHAYRALAYVRAADQMTLGRTLFFETTCTHLGIPVEGLESVSFFSLILGTVVGKRVFRVADVVDRLIYGGIETNYKHLAAVAASVELQDRPAGVAADLERRIELAAAVANGMRRAVGGMAAQELLREMQLQLGVIDIPSWSFEQKGFVLYQFAYLAWLSNDPVLATETFEASARAAEEYASSIDEDRAKAALFRAKAIMSRIACARMHVENLAMNELSREKPRLEAGVISQSIDSFLIALERLAVLEPETNEKDRAEMKRYRLNALLHLGQARALLGDEPGVGEAVRRATEVDREIGRDAVLAMQLASGLLAFTLGRYQEVIDLLRDTPEKMMGRKAGETSGLRAQLCARAAYELQDTSDYLRWCSWLDETCPRYSGNGPAIDWARASLAAHHEAP